MVSCEFLLQLTQAKAVQSELPATARETERYPKGREKISAAGLKMKATVSRATVPVYWIPVVFWFDSNTADLLGCGQNLRGWARSPALAQMIRAQTELSRH
jgi:hypothetical protein